jgi:hypothetical protein
MMVSIPASGERGKEQINAKIDGNIDVAETRLLYTETTQSGCPIIAI